MEFQLIGLGMTHMLVGMGAVFLFLSLLVAATTLMSRLVMRFQPAVSAQSVEQEEIAAITTAIAHHRRQG